MLPLKNKAVGLIPLLLTIIFVAACQPGPNHVPASRTAAVGQIFSALELTLTKPAVVGECGGILIQADLPRYWKYPLGRLEV